MQRNGGLPGADGDPGGVNKRRGNRYTISVAELQNRVQQKLDQLAALELQKSRLLETESVLIDLVLQQENRLQHLQLMRSEHERAFKALQVLLDDTDLDEAYDLAGLLEDLAAKASTSNCTAVPDTCMLESSPEPVPCFRLDTNSSLTSSLTDTMQRSVSPGHSSDTCLTDRDSPCQGDQVQQPCHGRTSSARSGSQYCHELVMSATPQHWHRALSMTSEDWSTYVSNLVMRLCLLMDLLGRLGSDVAGIPAAAVPPTSASAKAADRSANKEDTIAEIEDIVDDFVTMANLCLLHNPLPLREAARYNHITREPTDVVPQAYWRQVNERLNPSSEQVRQLQLAYHQFFRVTRQVQQKQQRMVNCLGCSASAAAAEAATRGDARIREVEALAAAAGEHQELQQLLQHHMAGWTAAGGLLLQFYCNTLTRLQLARLLICSYPYLPRYCDLIGVLFEPDAPFAAAAQLRESQQAGEVMQDYKQQLRKHHGQIMHQHQMQWRQQHQLA